jgi:hypothetical protein
MLHHLKNAHHTAKRLTGKFLAHLAEEHPIITTALVLTGGTLVVRKFGSTGAPATNVPAKTTTAAGG